MGNSLGIYVGPSSIVASTRRGQQTDVIAWSEIAEGDDVFEILDAVIAQAEPQLSDDPIDVVVAVPGPTPHSTRIRILDSLTAVDTDAIRLVSSASASAASFIGYPSEPVFCLTWELQPGLLTCSVVARDNNLVLVDRVMYDHNWAWQRHGAFADAFTSSDRAKHIVLGMIEENFGLLGDEVIRLGILSEDADIRMYLLDPGDAGHHLMHTLARPSGPPELLTATDISFGASRIAASVRNPPPMQVEEKLALNTGLDISGEFQAIFPINCDLPVTTSFPGTRMEADQSDFLLAFVQGTADIPDADSNEVTFQFISRRPGKEGSTAVHIDISMTIDGLIDVKCRDARSGEHLEGLLLDDELEPLARVCEKCGGFSDLASRFCEYCGDPFTSLESVIASSPKREGTVPVVVQGSELLASSESTDSAPWPPQIQTTDSPESAPLEEFHECPYCAELIRVAAIKCRHCGERLVAGSALTAPMTNQSQTEEVSPDHRLAEDGPTFEWGNSRLKLFVSHATSDQAKAKEITDALAARGIATWLATRDIQVGDNYAAQIYEAISTSSHLLVLLSPTSVSSNHVKREVNIAIDKDISVLPLVIDDNADFLQVLPADWKYWLGVVQVMPYQGPETAAAALMRRLGVT